MIKRKEKDIDPINTNGEFHGYQEWYSNNKLWVRGNQKNGLHVGYRERHKTNTITGFISRDSTTEYFIR